MINCDVQILTVSNYKGEMVDFDSIVKFTLDVSDESGTNVNIKKLSAFQKRLQTVIRDGLKECLDDALDVR